METNKILRLCNVLKERERYEFRVCTQEIPTRAQHLPNGLFFHEGFVLDDEDLDYLHKKYDKKLIEEKDAAIAKANLDYQQQMEYIKESYPD